MEKVAFNILVQKSCNQRKTANKSRHSSVGECLQIFYDDVMGCEIWLYPQNKIFDQMPGLRVHSRIIYMDSYEHVPNMFSVPRVFVLMVFIGLYIYFTGEAGDAK